MIPFIYTSKANKTDLLWAGKWLEGSTKESYRVPDMFYFWVLFSQVLTLCKSIQWQTYELCISWMNPTLQWKAQESVENNFVKKENRPPHIGHFAIPWPCHGREVISTKGIVFLHSDYTWAFKFLKETFTFSFRDISLVFIFHPALISGMFSIPQSARPRSGHWTVVKRGIC